MLRPMDIFEINSKNSCNIGTCYVGRMDINKVMQGEASFTVKRDFWREVIPPKALPKNRRNLIKGLIRVI